MTDIDSLRERAENWKLDADRQVRNLKMNIRKQIYIRTFELLDELKKLSERIIEKTGKVEDDVETLVEDVRTTTRR